MATHVKVLGILNILGAVLGLMAALLLIVVFSGVTAAVAADGDPDAATAIPIIGLTGTAIVAFLVIWSLPGLVVGFGLYRFRPWARVAGIVVSIVALLAFPFGTLLGAYGLWVLFSKETEPLFAPTPSQT
jgi:hypothetical protein